MSPTSTPQKSTVWLSYDLGVRGDYEGLYEWLDRQGAKECGDSLAYFLFPYSDKMPERIKADINRSGIKIDKNSRLYLIFRDRDSNNNKGVFLFGGRRAAPWSGYAQATSTTVDEETQ